MGAGGVTGLSHQEVLAQALDHYERAYLLEAMNAGFDALRTDAAAWAEEEGERALWDGVSTDTSDQG